MRPEQWDKLLAVINGELIEPVPVGFVIDSPWLPGWAGISTIDYFSSEQMWFESNLKAVRQFPDIMFLPGFWAEFGMCTEPSAFGSKCSWPSPISNGRGWQENELPYADKIFTDIQDIHSLSKPNPKTDGLLPLVLNRLKHYQGQIEQAGHSIKFAVSRGPLNVASFLAGSTEFLMAIRTNPNETRKLLETVTDFIIDWLELQAETFASIDGIFILDDIVGFLGEEDFKEAALPYLRRIFQSLDVSVKFFHNDAPGLVCAPYLPQIGVNPAHPRRVGVNPASRRGVGVNPASRRGGGVNLFNFSFQHTLTQMKELTNNEVTLLGNIPTRDVLGAGRPEDVRSSVKAALESVSDKSRIILSCGGGMPPGASTENIKAFLSATK